MSALPAQVFVSEPGSFAEYTLKHRLPHILQDVRDQNDYPPSVDAKLVMLMQELTDRRVQPLPEESDDASFWNQAIGPWQEKTWNQLPWFLAETYFYRKILDAVNYFQPGYWQGYDPFNVLKKQGLEEGLVRVGELLQIAPALYLPFDTFQFWFFHSLWGNRSDFSNLMALSSAQSMVSSGNNGLLVDESSQVWHALQRTEIERMDIVCDNVGPELLTDLAFADMVLTQKFTKRVVMHVKAQPYYVSDAMIRDVETSVQTMKLSTSKAVSSLGTRIDAELMDGRLCCISHPFWTSYLTLFQIPPDLIQDISQAQLILFKGDVNYRRLLDDRHWSSTTPLAQIANQVPSDYVALRSIKSELICGLVSGQAERIAQCDPDWLINGRWGLAQYVERSSV